MSLENPMMPTDVSDPTQVETLLARANGGSEEAQGALIECCLERLQRMARRMLHRQSPPLRRWEETDDVLQQTWLRLRRALANTKPQSAREFYGIAAREIRWELIDLWRHHFGPEGFGANHESRGQAWRASQSGWSPHDPPNDTDQSAELMDWADFHEQVDRLPEPEREIFDLLWYQQVSQADAASLLGISLRTVKRRWQRAKLQLCTACNGRRPA